MTRILAASTFTLVLPLFLAFSLAHAAPNGGAVEDLVVICPERLAPSTRARITKGHGQGALRARQQYATVARRAEGRCRKTDGGVQSCLGVGSGVGIAALKDGGITIPTLKRPSRVDEGDEGMGIGESGEDADTVLQLRLDACTIVSCDEFKVTNPGFCNRPSGIKLMEPACVMPNCWTADGGWNDNAEVDCQWRGPDLSGATMTRWNGCNVMPKANAVGNACVPTNCEVVAGESGASL